MGAATDLHNLALDVLGAAAAILDTLPAGAPERQIVPHGPPVLDCCNQLAVHVQTIGEAPTAAATTLGAGLRHTSGRVNLTTLVVTLTRDCYPAISDSLKPPSAAAINAASAELNADAWALWNGLYRMRDSLFAGCDLVFFDGLIPLEPQGSCAGWVFQIRFELQGYAPAVGS